MPAHTSELPPATVEYLELVSKAHLGTRTFEEQVRCPGVIFSEKGAIGSPRSYWALMVGGGIAFLVLAGLLVVSFFTLGPKGTFPVSMLFGLLIGVGYVLIQTGRTRKRRPAYNPNIGHFSFVDGTRVWQVQGGYVSTFEFGTAFMVNATEHRNNGIYQHTVIRIQNHLGKNKKWIIPSDNESRRVLDFLHFLKEVRKADKEGTLVLDNDDPNYVAREAFILLPLNNSKTRPDPMPPICPIPVKVQESSGYQTPLGGIAIRWAVGLVIASLLTVGAWQLNEILLENRVFEAAQNDKSESLQAIEAYLQAYPEGRFVEEVKSTMHERMAESLPNQLQGILRERFYLTRYRDRFPNGPHIERVKNLLEDWYRAAATRPPTDAEQIQRIDQYLHDYPKGRYAQEMIELRDDTLYDLGLIDVRKRKSVTGLRKYLADPQNTRHREEAKKELIEVYEKMIANLRARQQPQGNKTNAQLMDFIIPILDQIKLANDSVVTVNIVPNIVPEPKDELTKRKEADNYKEALTTGEEKVALQNAEKNSVNSSAIIHYADLFSAERLRMKEALILQRLNDAINQGFDGQLLTFERAKAGEKAHLQINYSISPTGELLVYYDILRGTDKKAALGLLREYTVSWRLTNERLADGPQKTFEIETQQHPDLTYYPGLTDPKWGIYAASLQSAFLNFADALVTGLGRTPERSRHSFNINGFYYVSDSFLHLSGLSGPRPKK